MYGILLLPVCQDTMACVYIMNGTRELQSRLPHQEASEKNIKKCTIQMALVGHRSLQQFDQAHKTKMTMFHSQFHESTSGLQWL